MNIVISGYADKRALIYPLLKLLQPRGNILLITDNTNCKRLLENYEDLGHFMNVLVTVTSNTSDEIYELIGYEEDNFDYVIIDCKNYYPENISYHYSVTGERVDEDEQQHIDLLGDTKCKFILSCKNKKEAGKVTIQFTPQLCSYLENVETYKVLPPTVSIEVVKQLAKDFAYELNLTEKQIVTILKKGWELS